MSNIDIMGKCKSKLMTYKNIVFAYIFGSYAKGKLGKDSDIDIALYLNSKIDAQEYLKIKMELTSICKRDVDLVILNDAINLHEKGTEFVKHNGDSLYSESDAITKENIELISLKSRKMKNV